ncbi:hypothetical protein KSS87_001830 [Heliosperma pusillum]|nr:hypothetical protein KSS87_001830 [Heliosperma pusillum]
MAAASSSIPNSFEPLTPFLFLNLNQCLKLTPLTYRSWTTQIEDILFGFDLFKFVDGSHPCPSPTKLDADKKEVTNPAYHTWVRQDRLIKGALLGTIDTAITPLLLNDKTSHSVWTTLCSTYDNPSRSHILQVKDRLKSITKGDKSATEFMQAIRTCTNELAHLGKPMDAEDIIGQVIEGLDYAKYKPVIDALIVDFAPESPFLGPPLEGSAH